MPVGVQAERSARSPQRSRGTNMTKSAALVARRHQGAFDEACAGAQHLAADKAPSIGFGDEAKRFLPVIRVPNRQKGAGPGQASQRAELFDRAVPRDERYGVHMPFVEPPK